MSNPNQDPRQTDELHSSFTSATARGSSSLSMTSTSGGETGTPSHAHFGPTAQKVLMFLKHNRGRPFAAEALSRQTNSSVSETLTVLDMLEVAGFIDRRQSTDGEGRHFYLIPK